MVAIPDGEPLTSPTGQGCQKALCQNGEIVVTQGMGIKSAIHKPLQILDLEGNNA